MIELGHHGSVTQDSALKEARSSTAGQITCLALVEIADFAGLRRRLGIRRTDLLIIDIAERIAALLPEADVALFGRNLLELRTRALDQIAVEVAVAQVHAGFEHPIGIDGEPLQVTLVLGLATATGPNVDDVQLVEEAECALIEARGGNATIGSVSTLAEENALAVSRDLRRAVKRDELFLQYQPKLHLRRQEIVSIEALIRWQHPRRGLVLPNDFIPAAERTGAIAAMTMWTLRQAITDQRVLGRNGRTLPIFINIAGVLLSDKEFVDEVVALVGESGATLGFEITETSVIREPDSAILHLQRLVDIGIEIAIDDYGAGLSSLAYLKKLPARELKIDKLFVTQLTSSHRDPLIVRSTIDLAHALEMEVVAEGVETATALALLSVMGCDMVQGFLISRPLGLESLLAYLREDSHRAVCQAPRVTLERLVAVQARA